MALGHLLHLLKPQFPHLEVGAGGGAVTQTSQDYSAEGTGSSLVLSITADSRSCPHSPMRRKAHHHLEDNRNQTPCLASPADQTPRNSARGPHPRTNSRWESKLKALMPAKGHLLTNFPMSGLLGD